MKIQINDMRSNVSLAILKALSQIKKYDIEVIGSDICERGGCEGSLLVDKYYQAPLITQEAKYIDFLNEVNEKENIDLLIPTSDAEVALLSKCRNQVKTKFYLPHHEIVALLQDHYMRSNVWDRDIIVDVLSDKDGSPRLIVPRKILETRGGKIVKCQLVRDETVIEVTKKSYEMFKMPGLYNLSFVVNNGEYNFVGMQAIFAESGMSSIIASFNYVQVYLEHFVLNEPLQDIDYYMNCVCWGSIISQYPEELTGLHSF